MKTNTIDDNESICFAAAILVRLSFFLMGHILKNLKEWFVWKICTGIRPIYSAK